MITSICNVNFQGRFCRYSSHTPKMRPYKEFEFMPELQKKNPGKELFKNFGKMCNNFDCSIKSRFDMLRNDLEDCVNNLFYGNK